MKTSESKKDKIVTIRLTQPQYDTFVSKLNGYNFSKKIRELITQYPIANIN